MLVDYIGFKMPSIYNNENSCWGVKRTYIRPNLGLFQHDFCADVNQSTFSLKSPQDSTLTDGTMSAASTAVPNSGNQIKPICFSVSSNGYYGYQPHNQLLPHNQTNDSIDNEMDIDEGDFTMNHAVNEACLLGRSCTQIQNRPTEQTFSVHRKRHMHQDELCSGIKKPKHSGKFLTWAINKAVDP